eukprot:TRINITY_DN159_c0_g5_i2.p1 TRINITY_DN159_c0_g5~~TRINITY_DN159_c0_g5_i2.p1  ORF type:complete len:265 (-),score=87.58 TRINITY_DN159_c0_g5_i2:850-1644(-)
MASEHITNGHNLPTSHIFIGETFTLSSSFGFKEKKALQQAIQAGGGSTSYLLNKKISFYITKREEVENDTFNVRKAFQYNICLVSADYVLESISRNNREDPQSYSLEAYRVPEIPSFSFLSDFSQSSFLSISSPLLSLNSEKDQNSNESGDDKAIDKQDVSANSKKEKAKSDEETEIEKKKEQKKKRELEKKEERARRVARLLLEKQERKNAGKLKLQEIATLQKDEAQKIKLIAKEARLAEKQRRRDEYEEKENSTISIIAKN